MWGDEIEPNGDLLRVSGAAVGDLVTVSAAGEVDFDTSVRLADALEDAVTSGAQVIEVDLRGVEFCDCSGLHVLLRARERALEAGAGFSVNEPVAPLVARLFEVTETEALLLG
ncbi:STAS domain-containing protein [Streptomyces sp. NPDC002285]